MHKTADFHSKFSILGLVTEGYHGRAMKCAHYTHFKLIERPLPGMIISWFLPSLAQV